MDRTTATKADSGKADLTFIRLDAIEQVARVFMFGASKYPKENGMSNYLKGMSHTRLLAAALRHVMAYIAGEDKDAESGYSHLAHACCCLLMLLTYKAQNLGTDDRDLVPGPKLDKP